MGLKYIRNTDDATIICKLSSDKRKVFVFKPKKFDKRNNVMVSNGFTEVSDEDIKILRDESHTFRYYEANKKLQIVTNLPYESMSTDQLVVVLRNEIADLKKQLSKAEKQTPVEADTKALEEEVKKLNVALVQKDEEISKMQDIIDELNVSLCESPADEKEDETQTAEENK